LNDISEYQKIIYQGGFRTLLTSRQIEDRTRALGKQITLDYRGKQPILIGVLNGAFIFMADLVRHIELDIEVDFIKISSYGDAQVSSGHIQMLKDINVTITGRDVLIVEDIVDTGFSIQFLKEKFQASSPASLRFVSLLVKKENLKIDVHVDYGGFEIPNEFVIGYGLDHKQILRNLPAVYVMD
jgi:hypoxanthine phosphoribosyltransferase